MFWNPFRRIEAKLDQILAQGAQIMATLDDIIADVKAESDLDDSIITLLNGISQQLKDAIAANDPAKLQAVVDAIDANKAKISAAITANTPGGP